MREKKFLLVHTSKTVRRKRETSRGCIYVDSPLTHTMVVRRHNGMVWASVVITKHFYSSPSPDGMRESSVRMADWQDWAIGDAISQFMRTWYAMGFVLAKHIGFGMVHRFASPDHAVIAIHNNIV